MATTDIESKHALQNLIHMLTLAQRNNDQYAITSLDMTKMSLVSIDEAEELDTLGLEGEELATIMSDWHVIIDGFEENVGISERIVVSSWEVMAENTVRLELVREYTRGLVAIVELGDFCPHCGYWNEVDGNSFRHGVTCRKCSRA